MSFQKIPNCKSYDEYMSNKIGNTSTRISLFVLLGNKLDVTSEGWYFLKARVYRECVCFLNFPIPGQNQIIFLQQLQCIVESFYHGQNFRLLIITHIELHVPLCYFTGKNHWLAPSLVGVFVLMIPLWIVFSVKNKYTNEVVYSGWVPVLSAMMISRFV